LDAAAAEPKELLKQLDTTNEGLTSEAAATRLNALGPNLVAHERRQTVLEELIGRAKNPLNFLLLTLAAVSYFLGDTRAAAVIAGMVVLSVSLAFAQEHRSNNAAARLRAMVRTTATVLRRRPRPSGSGVQLEDVMTCGDSRSFDLTSRPLQSQLRRIRLWIWGKVQQAVDASSVHQVGAHQPGESERRLHRRLSGLGKTQQQEGAVYNIAVYNIDLDQR
jgi:hypothetical protein